MSEVGDTNDDTGCGDLLRIKNIGNIHHEDVYYKSFLGGTVVSRQENKQNLERKGGNKKIIIVGVIAMVIIAVLVGVIVFLLKPQEEEKRNVVVNKENVEDVIEKMEDKDKISRPTYYEAKMNSTWYFADGKSSSTNAYVENVETNTTDVYFDVICTDTNETIYESPLLPRGSYLEDITLDTELNAGTYDCILIYHLVDENQKTLSTVRFALTIVVEN